MNPSDHAPVRANPTRPDSALCLGPDQPLGAALTRRRALHTVGALGVVAMGTADVAFAQQVPAPVEGKDFLKLATALPVTPGGKVDVVEFFWYGCPHCNAFQPALEAWIKKIPADVNFRRAPVMFSPTHETHAKLYFALEDMGALETVHRRVFTAIHQNRQRLDKEADINTFVTSHGVDAAKFSAAWRSFGVATKMRQSKQLADGYRLEGVPALGIHGRFLTAPSLVGGDHYKALAVADGLIQRARKGG
jgi:protein dithiol oxidoreductase (disulfide-forming)